MNKIYELKNLLKHAAKKSKRISFSLAALISLLMNGEISSSDLVYGKFKYNHNRHSSQIGINILFETERFKPSVETTEDTSKNDTNVDTDSNDYKIEKFKKFKIKNEIKNKIITDGTTNIIFPFEKPFTFKISHSVNPKITPVNSVSLTNVEIPVQSISVDAPVVLTPNVVSPAIDINEYESPEIFKVAYQMPPVYKQGFSKKYFHYPSKNRQSSPIETATSETRIYLDDNGNPKTGDEQTLGYNNLITRNKKFVFKPDYLYEKYAPHYGNLITQLDLTEGTYDLYFKGYSNEFPNGLISYKPTYSFGFKVTNGAFSNTTDDRENSFPDNYEGELHAESFYRSSGREENVIGENVVVNAVGKFNDPIVYYITKKEKKEKREIKSNVNSIYYLSNPTVKVTKRKPNDSYSSAGLEELNPNKASTLVHKGTTNIYGDKIAVVNIDDVNSINDTVFKNMGTIIGHNEKGNFNEKEGNEAKYHIFGAFSYADGGKQIIHNTENGKVLLHAPKSMGVVFSIGNNQNTEKHFINDGELKLYGLSSNGILFNTNIAGFKREVVNFTKISLNKPLEILGDKSVGLSIISQPLTTTYKPIFIDDNNKLNNGSVNESLTLEKIHRISSLPIEWQKDYIDRFLNEKDDGKYYYKANDEYAENFENNKEGELRDFLIYKDLEGNNLIVKNNIFNKILVYPDEIKGPFFDSKLSIKIGSTIAEHQPEKSGNMVDGDENFVENSIAINFDYKLGYENKMTFDHAQDYQTYNNYQLELGETAKNSVAVRVAHASIQLEDNSDSYIKLNGENNIAMLSDGILPDNNGSELHLKNKNETIDVAYGFRGLKYDNKEHNITDSGKNNIIFASINSGKTEILNKFNSNFNSKGLTLGFSKGKKTNSKGDRISNVLFRKGIVGNISGDNSLLFYADDHGTIDINISKPIGEINSDNKHLLDEYNATPNVDKNSEALVVTGEDTVTFYAKDNGVINVTKTHIKAKDTSSVIVSKGEGAAVNIFDSRIDYDGDSYAIHSENNGKIHFENSELILRGNSIGLDQSQLNSIDGLNIIAMSNNIYASNAKNLGETNLTNLINFLNLQNVRIVAGEENGVRYDKYRDIFIDGITLNIDRDIDKKVAITNPDNTDPAYKLIKKYAIQKGKITLKNGNNIIAKLDSNDLIDLNRKSLIGYDLSGSGSSNSNADTIFTQEENTNIIVDRTDDGRGGVGLFINYGKIITNENSNILVEKSDTPANANSIGIFAVNGSEVESSGNITVGGNNSFGILATTYRRDDKDKLRVNEFLGKDKKGQVVVENKGNIILDGISSVGIFAEKNDDVEDSEEKAEGINSKNITLSGKNSIGMYAKEAIILNKGTISLTGEESRGMVGNTSSTITNDANANIILDNTNSPDKISIGIAAVDDETKIIHKGIIDIKKLGYGLYGNDITVEGATIKVGEGISNDDDTKLSVGIFSKSEGTNNRNLTTDNLSKIETSDYGIGIYTVGDSPINIDAKHSISLGKNSYSYYINSENAKLLSKNTNVDIKDNSMHILSLKANANITNETKINIIGNKAFGIYGNGNITNLADIDLTSSTGSIALYASENGIITNGSAGNNSTPVIRLGLSKPSEQNYSIAMATGDKDTNRAGTIINYGTIEATKDNSIAMYASGANALAKNYGNIKLSGNKSIGIYLENGAVAENHGTIEVVGNGSNIIGVVAKKGTTIKNYGTINISGANSKGIYLEKDSVLSRENGTITASNGAEDVYDKTNEEPKEKEIKIVENTTTNPPTITINDITYDFAKVDNVDPVNQNDKIKINDEIRDKVEFKPITESSNVFAATLDDDTLGLYVDTSGINFTRPFNGIENIENLKKIELIIGNEATKYSNKNVIEVGENILKPYNDMLATQNEDKTFEAVSSSYIWNVVAELNEDNNKVEKLYLVRTPFKDFGYDDDTKEFLEVLDLVYPEKSNNEKLENLFNKINNIGKGEEDVLAQTFEELRGNIYSSTSRRIKEAKRVFDSEFDTVINWSTDTKHTSKLKLFSDIKLHKARYNGLKDYNKYTIGLYSINENYLSDKSRAGMFYGLSYNKFDFKDRGKSNEEAFNGQIGYFRDELFGKENNFRYHLKFGINGTARNMNRNAYIVDETDNYKADYFNLGGFLDQEIAMKNKISNNLFIESKLGLDFGYSRTSLIKERNGGFNLTINPHNVFTLIPKLSVEVKNERNLDELWSLLYNAKLEINKDFGYMIEKQMKAKSSFSDKEYKLVKDNHLFSTILSAKVGLNKNDKNHYGAITGSYDFVNNSLRLGAEAKFNLDDYFENDNIIKNIIVDNKNSKDTNIKENENNNSKLKENENNNSKLKENEKENIKAEVIEIIPKHCSLNEKECIIHGFKVDGRHPEDYALNFIKEIIEIVNTYAIDGSVDITGHTDYMASIKYNQKLSEDRANNIAKLLRKYGLKADVKFGIINGKSELEPMDTNKTVPGRFNNRRVVLKFKNVNYKHEMNK